MVKECPPGKILNPKTNRCIKQPKDTKQPKECPPGKVLNPKTNRCIKQPKESKQTKEFKDSKESKQDKQSKDSKQSKQAKDSKQSKQLKQPKECPPGKILNPKTNRCIKDVSLLPKCKQGEVLRNGKCVCGFKHVWSEKEQKCVCPPGLTYNERTGFCADLTDYEALYYKIINSFPTTYKVYLDIPYKNKDKAKEIGAKWDYAEKKWYYTQDTKLGDIYKLNFLSYPKPDVYEIKIPIICKDDIKKLGLHWDNTKKTWYYFSNLPEKNINILEKYDWKYLCDRYYNARIH